MIIQGTKQEIKNVKRIIEQRRAANQLYKFCQKGFRSFAAFKTTCMFYDPSISENDAKNYWQLSHLITTVLNDKVEFVIQKLTDE